MAIKLLSTLWSKIPIQNAYMTEHSVSDFYRIMASVKQLDSTRFNEEDEHCFSFLKKAIYESKAKHIIVVTHHVPSELLTDPAFKDSSILPRRFTIQQATLLMDCKNNK